MDSSSQILKATREGGQPMLYVEVSQIPGFKQGMAEERAILRHLHRLGKVMALNASPHAVMVSQSGIMLIVSQLCLSFQAMADP